MNHDIVIAEAAAIPRLPEPELVIAPRRQWNFVPAEPPAPVIPSDQDATDPAFKRVVRPNRPRTWWEAYEDRLWWQFCRRAR